MDLSAPIDKIPGITSRVLPQYSRLHIKTINDLITNYPRRYEDYSSLSKISKLKPGPSTIEIHLTSIGGRYLRRGLHMTQAIGRDDSGSIKLIWFNQPYRAKWLKKDTDYFVSGNYQLSRQQFSMINPSIELKKSFPLNTARILPKYRETKGLTSRDIRKAIKEVLPLIRKTNEELPEEIVSKYKLMDLAKAIEMIHFPESTKQIEKARNRLAFNEVFELMLASELNKQAYSREKSLAINFDAKLASKFVSELPFKLTDDQRRAIWQIYMDMSKTSPMNRLVEGDVGTGKTVVALMAALMAMNQGQQTALMAPTELLARQHAETINKLLKPLGLSNKVSLMIGNMSKQDKIEAAKASIVIGTHALISESVSFNDLVFVVIDEQHRFGVNQRKELKRKAKTQPHLLSLSATPIPRSLALTMFGELDMSRLREKPSGRVPISTKVISESAYQKELSNIANLLKEGNQMYVVCPTIDSELDGKKKSLKTVYEQCLKDYKSYKIAMLHGKMSSEDKDAVMEKFINHDIDILVSTTLIEVGIDVPNANVMVIMSSDNFGLAQLHQLRGRVGRGKKAAYCFLVHDNSQTPGKRLNTMETCDDGFKLAEIDLELRGPGAIYGSFQHGQLDLRLTELSDTALLKSAKEAVKYFVSSGLDLVQYKRLHDSVRILQKITNLN